MKRQLVTSISSHVRRLIATTVDIIVRSWCWISIDHERQRVCGRRGSESPGHQTRFSPPSKRRCSLWIDTCVRVVMKPSWYWPCALPQRWEWYISLFFLFVFLWNLEELIDDVNGRCNTPMKLESCVRHRWSRHLCCRHRPVVFGSIAGYGVVGIEQLENRKRVSPSCSDEFYAFFQII